MSKLPTTRADRVQASGALRKVPGYESGGANLDQMPFIMDFGSLAYSTTAASTSPRRVVPFDAYVVGIGVAAATALTATGLLTIGDIRDTDSLVDDYPLASLASGFNTLLDEVTAATTVIAAGRTLSKGDVLQASITQVTGTAGAGVIAPVLIIRPR